MQKVCCCEDEKRGEEVDWTGFDSCFFIDNNQNEDREEDEVAKGR
jgi:hypothetical protein